MARDKGLEEQIREELGRLDGLHEVAMFGGLAWMLDGNLLCACRHDGLLARLGKGNEAWALAMPGVGEMQMGARKMNGWVRADPDAVADDSVRARLLEGALAFVRTLPPK
ncbi:MAG TPA: TfoX/Sxy family protein [Caulobacteraceae bacterium]|jgi:hypothetical protein